MEIVPHPRFLEALFAFQSKVSGVFLDILGIYEIDHISITQVNSNRNMLTFSSSPAMEYNLFNSNLWRYDKSYQLGWLTTCSQADWGSLYNTERYDDLYYLKQIKHHYPIGYSLAAKLSNNFFIYSLASSRSCGHTRDIFAHQHEDFYKIGQYCTNMLGHLFQNFD